ncbi:MAG: hypothetical protein QM757_07900 [Paludibaculum sp.]
MNGVIVVDKPCGWTSHDVVNKMRRLAGTTKVGHLGTLDPLATGVLPLLLNRATRLAQYFSLNEKSYEGTIRFGFSTATYDAGWRSDFAETQPDLTPETVELAFAPVLRHLPADAAGGFRQEDQRAAGA